MYILSRLKVRLHSLHVGIRQADLALHTYRKLQRSCLHSLAWTERLLWGTRSTASTPTRCGSDGHSLRFITRRADWEKLATLICSPTPGPAWSWTMCCAIRYWEGVRGNHPPWRWLYLSQEWVHSIYLPFESPFLTSLFCYIYVYSVIFRLVVFKPFIDEIILAKVSRSSREGIKSEYTLLEVFIYTWLCWRDLVIQSPSVFLMTAGSQAIVCQPTVLCEWIV